MKRNSTEQKQQRGFTLIELLVVVAVILLLARILLPAIDQAQQQARAAQCVNNLHQLGLAFATYLTDWNSTYPGGAGCCCTQPDTTDQWLYLETGCGSWRVKNQGALKPYMGNGNILKCPLFTGNQITGYVKTFEFTVGGWGNRPSPGAWAGIKKSQIKQGRSADYILVFEQNNPDDAGAIVSLSSDTDTIAANDGGGNPATLHNGKSECLFADGHVEAWTMGEMQKACYTGATLLDSCPLNAQGNWAY